MPCMRNKQVGLSNQLKTGLFSGAVMLLGKPKTVKMLQEFGPNAEVMCAAHRPAKISAPL